jgi:hypothetical protein
MTMDGEVVHEWAYTFNQLWPDVDPGDIYVDYWRRVHVFENGDVIAIIEPHGVFKLDKDSNLLWENHCGAHHDFAIAPNGHIFVLTRQRIGLDLGEGYRPILEEFVVELGPDGNELKRVSILDALRNTPYQSLLKDAPDYWDILHTNTLKLIPAGMNVRIPAFKPGRILLSLRELGAVTVLDFDNGTIEWAIKGQWYRQHEATLVGPGNILLFDNRGNNGRSKAIEVDPVTREILWSYGMREDEPLFSHKCGLTQRLPNGNTLITEAQQGRVIEVTRDGTVVWEYINPHRVKHDNSIIATLMDFKRLAQSFHPAWLETSATSAASGVDDTP